VSDQICHKDDESPLDAHYNQFFPGKVMGNFRCQLFYFFLDFGCRMEYAAYARALAWGQWATTISGKEGRVFFL